MQLAFGEKEPKGKGKGKGLHYMSEMTLMNHKLSLRRKCMLSFYRDYKSMSTVIFIFNGSYLRGCQLYITISKKFTLYNLYVRIRVYVYLRSKHI